MHVWVILYPHNIKAQLKADSLSLAETARNEERTPRIDSTHNATQHPTTRHKNTQRKKHPRKKKNTTHTPADKRDNTAVHYLVHLDSLDVVEHLGLPGPLHHIPVGYHANEVAVVDVRRRPNDHALGVHHAVARAGREGLHDTVAILGCDAPPTLDRVHDAASPVVVVVVVFIATTAQQHTE